MTTFFTADQHFYHKNVIDYCQRPFKDLKEMHEVLIDNYNAVVKDDDTVYFLGDIIFAGTQKAAEILGRLKGKKHLIMGNHDRQNRAHKWATLGFETVKDHGRFETVLLSHFPYMDNAADGRKFDEQIVDRGHWLLHGHVHQHWKVRNRMINVGVDQWDFKPVAWETLKELMK